MTDLIALLQNSAPLTGKELVLKSGMDTFEAWKNCTASDKINTCIVGKRYLRLDRKVEGYARLSPSIMREFLNYTVIGLAPDSNKAISKRAEIIEKEVSAISSKKIKLARDTIHRLLSNSPHKDVFQNKAVYIIAGDVVFGMAHAEPRPESSTGELVRGSDLDIIAITEGMAEELIAELDGLIYQEKYSLLTNPVVKEELDYLIKNMHKVRQQLPFSDFKAMVASKILYEGQYLYGNPVLFKKIEELLIAFQIPHKIKLFEEKAQKSRIEAEKSLLVAGETADHEELMALFYTTEEKEEIF